MIIILNSRPDLITGIWSLIEDFKFVLYNTMLNSVGSSENQTQHKSIWFLLDSRIELIVMKIRHGLTDMTMKCSRPTKPVDRKKLFGVLAILQ